MPAWLRVAAIGLLCAVIAQRAVAADTQQTMTERERKMLKHQEDDIAAMKKSNEQLADTLGKLMVFMEVGGLSLDAPNLGKCSCAMGPDGMRAGGK